VSELIKDFRQKFQDEEYRNSYAEGFLNSYVAAQIKMLREQRGMTQEQLGEKIGTQQSGIARLENTNYSAWKTETLVRLCRAFHVRLKISFEEFGTLPPEIESFNRDALQRRPFDKDPIFFPEKVPVVASALASDSAEAMLGKLREMTVPVQTAATRLLDSFINKAVAAHLGGTADDVPSLEKEIGASPSALPPGTHESGASQIHLVERPIMVPPAERTRAKKSQTPKRRASRQRGTWTNERRLNYG
jgi:transcriptional regulator with XRE-family HTH domain